MRNFAFALTAVLATAFGINLVPHQLQDMVAGTTYLKADQIFQGQTPSGSNQMPCSTSATSAVWESPNTCGVAPATNNPSSGQPLCGTGISSAAFESATACGLDDLGSNQTITGTKTFSAFVTASAGVGLSSSLLAPVVTSTASGSTSQQSAIEAGFTTLSAGTGSASFSPAFAASPICTCVDSTSAQPVQCGATGTTLGINGTGSDAIQWICIGKK